MITNWTLEEVAAWGPRWPELGRNEDFLRPHPGIWPGDARRIAGLINHIHECLDAANRLRFNQAVLASLALSPRRSELVPLLTIFRHDLETCVLPFSLEELAAMNWIRVPTLLADDQRGEMRFVLLGQGETGTRSRVVNEAGGILLGTRFQVERMDRTAAEAVKLALNLAGVPGAVIWPIVEPHLLGPSLHGDSLALPVALGAWLLRQGRDWPEGLACTGGLSDTGKVTAVDNVPVKARIAANTGFRVLLHPERSFDMKEWSCPDPLTGADVRTLDQAQKLAACFHPDHAPEMAALLNRLRDPVRILDAAAAVPVAFLEYLAGEEPDLRERLAAACLRSENAAPLLKRLDTRTADRALSLSELSNKLRLFFPFDIWRTQALETPEVGVTVARLHLETANHQGLLREFADWEPVLRKACAGLSVHQDNRGEELLAATHALVGGLHNRYAFNVSTLDERVHPLADVIHELGEEWRNRRQRCPDACCKQLGRYYGTLAQHYGFCGPAHLDEVERHVRLAQEAFGNGRILEKRADWRRGFSYLFHARLDAGRHETLRQSLEAYLDRPLDALDYAALNPFEQYHLAKFMAFTSEDIPGYLGWAAARLPDAPPQHPWQLWALNLGKAATTLKDKTRFLQTSLRLCRAATGPTVRAMALMPLTWQVQAGLVERDQAAREAEGVVEEIRAGGLDQAHFAVLFGLEGQEILERALEDEAKLFPFGYR